MLTIRLQRTGKRNQADFRIVLAEKQAPVKKRHLEVLGSYNPRSKNFKVNEERTKYWITQRVELSPTVHNFFVTKGLVEDVKVKAFNIPKKVEPSSADVSAEASAKAETLHDSICLFVTGAGTGIRERAEEYKARGEYLKSHALQALAIETAEAAAEWLHRRIREDWGFPDPAGMTMIDRFTTKYRGRRYSFGYPACPALEDQAAIWKLLRPEEIGVQLTEGFMMDPEASVSALVFHHPDCTYFGVGETTD